MLLLRRQGVGYHQSHYPSVAGAQGRLWGGSRKYVSRVGRSSELEWSSELSRIWGETIPWARDFIGWVLANWVGKAIMFSFSELRSQKHVFCAQDQPRDYMVHPTAANSAALSQSLKLRAGDCHLPVHPTKWRSWPTKKHWKKIKAEKSKPSPCPQWPSGDVVHMWNRQCLFAAQKPMKWRAVSGIHLTWKITFNYINQNYNLVEGKKAKKPI